MKKTLLFLSALLMAITASAQTAYKTLTFPDENSENNAVSAYTETWTATVGTDSWTIENFNNNSWNNSWTYIKCGRKNNASVASIASPAIDQPVSTVVVTIDKITDATLVNSIKLVVASDAEFATEVETVEAAATSIAAGDLTFTVTTPTAGEYYKLVFDCASASKNGVIQVSKVVYNTNASVEVKKAAGLAWSASKTSVKQGDEFTAPTFSQETTATVTFATDNADVATVDASGVITLGTALGTAVITASSEANDEYEAGTATTTVEVYALNNYVKATTLEAGKSYVLVALRNDSLAYAYPQGESKTYGYLYSNIVSPAVDTVSIKSSYDDTFTFTAADEEGQYYIQDCYGRYLFHESGSTYNTFNFTADQDPDYAWTVEAQEDGTYKLSQPDGYYVQWGDSKYTSFGLYNEARTNAVLPYLYELATEPVEPEYPYMDGDTVVYRKDFDPAGAGFTILVSPVDWEKQYLYVSLTVSDKRTQDLLSVGPEGKSSDWTSAIHTYLTSTGSGNQTVWYFGTRTDDDNSFVPGEMTIELSKANGYVVNGTQRIAPENLSSLFALETIELSDQEANGSQTSTSVYHLIALKPVDTATGINAIQTVSDNENAPMYNLAGQRVGKDYKGIVIVNGKKTLK